MRRILPIRSAPAEEAKTHVALGASRNCAAGILPASPGIAGILPASPGIAGILPAFRRTERSLHIPAGEQAGSLRYFRGRLEARGTGEAGWKPAVLQRQAGSLRYCGRSLLVLTICLLTGGRVFGAERFPPPDFSETNHQLPETTTPAPRVDTYDFLDVAVLLVVLGLASYFVLKSRSRRRVLILSIFSLAYFGFWRKGCICSIGSIQNVALALFGDGYVMPLSAAAFFILPLAFTLFFGRTFCAAVCPHGAIQDLVLVRPVVVPTWLEHALRLLAYLYLGGAVLLAGTGTAFIICQYDPFIPIFRLSGGFGMLLLGGCFLLAGLFVARPYCRFFCPYGILLRLLAKVSKWHAEVTPDECVVCRLCEDSCPVGAIDIPTARQGPTPPRASRGRLVVMLLLLPVIVAACGWLGGRLPVPSPRPYLDRPAQLRLAAAAPPRAETQPSGRDDRFGAAGVGFGAWVGLVVGLTLVRLCVTRTRSDYRIDRGSCVNCARCFEYCPVELARIGKIEGIPDEYLQARETE